MRLFAATMVGSLLFAASFALLAAADEALDATAIAGGTGLVLSGALLGLTLLARRWRSAAGYVETVVTANAFYEDVASAFETDFTPAEDAPARPAAAG